MATQRARKRGKRASKAAAFRLAPEVRPLRYALALELDPQRSRAYRGTVRIELELARAVPAIELHAVDLSLRAARITAAGSTRAARIAYVAEHESVRITPASAIATGKALLEIEFSGKLRSDLRGLYFARSGRRRYAFSQLEAADARRFFPCFDEPSFKARFTLEVVTAAGHAVVSNSRVSERKRLPGGKQRVRFEETPRLSTYLVALAVGELNASRKLLAGKTEIRIWHVPGAERLTGFALRGARECLLALERYFAVPYPYGKLDLLAVPDFDMGAMENAGAVFFRETLLLIDEARATLPEKKRSLEVICHELAHMWYGNLVTMAWWDDLWLNEAFATWMAFDIVHKLHPELRMWNDFGHSRDSALSLDALDNTHPIYTEVRTAAEATQNFDLITYEKGASVIRMLERYLGEQRFQRGVRAYIKEHREQNATAADLWRALARQAGEQIDSVVRPWVERPGFPLLRATRAGAGRRTLALEQERFSAKGPGARKRAEAPWPVPVVLKVGAGKTKPRLLRTLVDRARARVRLPAGTSFVYANADEGGFYRPLHDARTLAELTRSLQQLEATERLGLASHAFALMRAGYAEVDGFLELALALSDERDPDVLGAVSGSLAFVLDRIASAAAQPRLRAVIGGAFGPALRAVGWEPRRSESEHDRLRRAELLALCALVAENPTVLDEAEQRLRAYLRDARALEPNLVGPSVVAAARRGDAALHARYFALSRRSQTPQERRRFRMALAEFRDPACVRETLALCASDRLPGQDMPLVLARLFDNPAAREIAWDYLRKHWRVLEPRISPQLAHRLVEATPGLQGEQHRREVLAFFTKHRMPTAERALQQADERFRLDGALRKRAAPALDRWLRARGQRSSAN